MTHKSMGGLGAPELFNKPLAPHEFDAPDLDQNRKDFELKLRGELERLHAIATDSRNPHWQTAADNLLTAIGHLCDYDNLNGIEPRKEALFIPEQKRSYKDESSGDRKLGSDALYDHSI